MEVLVRKDNREIVAIKPNGSPWGRKERNGPNLRVIRVRRVKLAKVLRVARDNLPVGDTMPRVVAIVEALTGSRQRCFVYPAKVIRTRTIAGQKVRQMRKRSGLRLKLVAVPDEDDDGTAAYSENNFEETP